MGIRLYLTCVSQADLNQLVQLNDSLAAAEYMDALQKMYFWPMTEADLTKEYNHLCIEKSYWELLNRILGTHIDNDPEPVLDLVEDGQMLVDYSWGYGSVQFYSPDQTQGLFASLNAIAGTSFRRRYAATMRVDENRLQSAAASAMEETDETDDDQDHLFLAIEFCFETTQQFVSFAVERGEALLCYVG